MSKTQNACGPLICLPAAGLLFSYSHMDPSSYQHGLSQITVHITLQYPGNPQVYSNPMGYEQSNSIIAIQMVLLHQTCVQLTDRPINHQNMLQSYNHFYNLLLATEGDYICPKYANIIQNLVRFSLYQ